MEDVKQTNPPTSSTKPKRGWFRKLLRAGFWLVIVLILAAVAVRPFMPRVILYYVNRTLNQSPLYRGKIGDLDLSLYRGAYTIRDVRILKTTADVPVPLFSAKEVDLHVDWRAVLHGKIVGQIEVNGPEINFVDNPNPDQSETGSGGPWLQIIRGLFPFDINSVLVHNGSVHFRTFQRAKPVDVYLSHLETSVDDLTNVNNSLTPLLTTVHITALAMDQAKLELNMKLNPFSYKPTFHLDLRLLGLDLTTTNELIEVYGGFNVKRGLFDVVIDLTSNEGELTGYVKPLFRNMIVFDLVKDVQTDQNPIQFFWQAIVGGVSGIITNYNRDQLGTLIPFTGELAGPRVDYLATVGNALRNAFIRAYLPRLESQLKDQENLQFGAPTLSDPVSAGD